MSKKFKIGDKVTLVSGGPVMTISGHQESGFSSLLYTGNVYCTWFNVDKLERGTFPEDAVVSVP